MKAGEVVAGRFAIQRVAGRGAMGVVYRAKDLDSGEPAALKVLHGDASVQRFAREAAVLAELRHPGIVRYHGHGALPDGRPWLAMEWVEGETLADRIGRSSIATADAVGVVRRIAAALEAAHQRGVVHRDLKPGNVALAGGSLERPKILDFGIAHATDRTALTATGAVMGTPSYMAPEQARGEPVDARADVFALGCILFKCLTGRAPFVADSLHALLLKIVLEEAPPLMMLRPDLPEAVDDVVGRLLAKAPSERARDAAAVRALLDGLGTLDAAAAAPPSLRHREVTTGERRVTVIALVRTEATASSAADGPVAAAAQRHGARLDVLADGGVLITTEGRGAATDQAIRAARCAVTVRNALPRARMVLAFAVSDDAGRVAMGDVIDRSVAQLDADARAGGPPEIRLDPTIAALLEGRFDVVAIEGGPALRGERREAIARRKLLGQAIPCLGRDHEVSTLAGALDQCIEESSARVVLVTAAAGAGKSRLREEFLRRVGEHAEPVSVWVAYGDALAAGSPLGMLARMLRTEADLRDGEPVATGEAKFRARVARNLATEDAARTAEFLAELAGLPPSSTPSVELTAARADPALMSNQMRLAWEEFARAEVATRPLVVVLEDLHWGDAATVKLVDALLRSLSDQPLFVVAFARPEVHELFPKLWANRSVQEIALRELGKRACERIVRQALGAAATDEVIRRVVERAAGNPFYLEELVRAEATGRSGALPDSVLATVEARFEALEPEARRVLRAASIFGEVFWRAGVLALLGASSGDKGALAEDWLRVLEDEEIVVSRDASRFPDEAEYAFHHALVRDAAYATLPKADLETGHLLAGAWLETKGAADDEVLASHFVRAGETGRAAACYLRAANRALAAYELRRAIDLCDRAERCGAAGAALAALHLARAEAWSCLGDGSAARSNAEVALALFERGSRSWGRAIVILAGHLNTDPRNPVELLLPLVDFDPPPGSESAMAGALSGVSFALLNRGSRADEIWHRLAAIPRESLDANALAWVARVTAARARMVDGDVSRALALLTEAARHFTDAGDARNGAIVVNTLVWYCIVLGWFEEAVARIRPNIVACTRIGLVQPAAHANRLLGVALGCLGKFGAARAALDLAASWFDGAGDRYSLGTALVLRARVELLAGDYDAAKEVAGSAIAMLERGPQAQMSALAFSSIAIRLGGRADEALPVAARANEMLRSLGYAEERPLVELAHAEALRAAGREQESREAIRAARVNLLTSAAKITDERLRASFVSRVAENARILACAAAWLGPEHAA